MVFLTIAVTTILIFLIAGLSLYRNPRSYTNVLLAILSILLGLWTISNYLSNIATDSEDAFLWVKAVMIITTIAGPTFYVFCKTFPRRNLGVGWKTLLPLSMAVVFVILLVLFNQVFSDVSVIEGKIALTPSWGVAVYGILLVSTLLGGFYSIALTQRRQSGLVRSQARILLIGTILTFSTQVATNFLFVVVLGITSVALIGPSFSLILVGSIFYSIARYRFLDIRLAIRLVTIRILTVVLITLIVWGYLIYVIEFLQLPVIILSLLLSVVLVLAFPSVNKILNNFADTYFFSDIRQREELINNLLIKLNVNIDIVKLLPILKDFIKKILLSSSVSYVFIEGTKEEISDFEIFTTSDLQRLKYLIDEIVVVSEQKYLHEEDKAEEALLSKEYIELLSSKDVEIVIPIKGRGEIMGYILLGPKENSYTYSSFDLKNIRIIGEQASLVISNALLFKEVSEFNAVLQTKVDEATSELQQKIRIIQDARRKERDMMDIMGHELRTPLSIIKIKQSLLRSKLKKGEQVSIEELKKIDKDIQEALEREIGLLETMLSSTKIDAGRMELNLDETDLRKIIDDAILSHQSEVEEKDLKVVVKDFDSSLTVYADKVRLAEVVDNFVSNAIKYTEKGSVTIEVKEKGKMVNVSVIDTGMGIPEHALDRLGERFFRVNQYSNGDDKNGGNNIVRPGGTGLGLYVSFGLVDLMGGKIDVKSKVGEGSIFTFTIPKFVGQKPKVSEDKGKDLFRRMGFEDADRKTKGGKKSGDGESNSNGAEVESKE